MSIYILDTETTGLTSKDEIIEMAWIKLNNTPTNIEVEETFNQRYRPNVPINPHAYKVHNISFKDVLTKTNCKKIEIPKRIDYIIGHNISFDKRMLEQSNNTLLGQLGNIKYICTRELARAVSKQFKLPYLNNKLDTIIQFHFEDRIQELIPENHEALSDCRKCLEYLKVVFELLPALDTWDKVYNFQQLINKDTYANKTT
jgi:exodeoxyribonuclease X